MNVKQVVAYCIKDKNYTEVGMGDIEAFVSCLVRKVNSKEALLVKAIKEGVTDDTLYQEHSEAMFRSGHKVPEFRRRYLSSSIVKKKLIKMEAQDWFTDNHHDLFDWLELLRRGSLPKECYHLWLHGMEKSWGKTTFLKLLQAAVNVPDDPGYNVQVQWQDSLSDKNTILACDSIQGPSLPFRIVEILATSKYEFQKRHGGGIFWQGPMVCTSNKSYHLLGYVDKAREPMDMAVWDARFMDVKLTAPLHTFNAWFAKCQGLPIAKYGILSNDSPLKRI